MAASIQGSLKDCFLESKLEGSKTAQGRYLPIMPTGTGRSVQPSGRVAAKRHCKHAAPQAPRSSITRRSADSLARRSRQARRTVSARAAGIDAASMARRCQNNI